MPLETFGDWCPYRDTLFCQEREGCGNCYVFYEESLRYDRRSSLGFVEAHENWGDMEADRRMEERRLRR